MNGAIYKTIGERLLTVPVLKIVTAVPKAWEQISVTNISENMGELGV